ncbi:hypothetical protein [Streptomyces sp. NPDC000410]|uniref:DUF7847 domain-containing protein n=1 Tax=Streptomyces sp. NPDC000410 TaxID=3154254 RepID=UPI003334046E
MSDNMGWGPHGGAPGPYGGAPGWGGWAPPPPPKPGVIPLRPLGLGDIMGGSFATIGRYWKQLFGIALAVYATAALIVVIALAVAYAAVESEFHIFIDSSDETAPSWDVGGPLIIAFIFVWLLAMVTMLLATAMLQASVAVLLQDSVLGRPTTFGPVWRRASARVFPVLGTILLTALISMVPVVLMMVGFVAGLIAVLPFEENDGAGTVALLGFLGALVTGPVAVWLWVKFSFAPVVAVFEEQGPIQAMRRSSALVRGDWWRIFGISLLVYVLAMVVSMVVQQLVSFIGMVPGALSSSGVRDDPDVAGFLVAVGGFLVFGMVAQLLAQIVTSAYPQLVVGLLYVDQRIRRENLAPGLAEAAGVPMAPVAPMPPGPYPQGQYPPGPYQPGQ